MKRWKIASVLFLVLVLVGALAGRWVWQRVVGPGAHFAQQSKVLFIPSGSNLDTVVDSLLALEAITDEQGFLWLAERKNYKERIKPGRYRIPKGISMNALLNMLRAGEQEPVKLSFQMMNDLEHLAGRVAHVLEPDSLAFLQAFQDPGLQRSVGLNEATIIALFIPDTYEFWWTTTPEQFISRMRKEHTAFWTEARTAQAKARGMGPAEVATLASIVQSETVKMEDAVRIAGVYLNRLRIGMPLQADPTLKFALGMPGVQRILHKDKDIDSPYNTYMYRGLPPGPITMPEGRFIDAVLQAEEHDHLYFCARADLSGYSDFTRNYEQHLVNARKYQRALDQRGIRR